MTRKSNEITEGMVDVLETALRELAKEADRNGCLGGSCLWNEDGSALDWLDDEDEVV